MIERDPGAVLDRICAFEPDAALPKWIDREETVYTRAPDDSELDSRRDPRPARRAGAPRARARRARSRPTTRARTCFSIGVLKGAVFFLADLMRQLEVDCEVDFMAVSSYGSSTDSVGRRAHPQGPRRVDRGPRRADRRGHRRLGPDAVLPVPHAAGAQSRASLEVCALLTKPERREVDLPIRYVGFEIPNKFAIGYGLDHAERYRNLPYVAVLERVLITPESAQKRRIRPIHHCYACVSDSRGNFAVSRFFKSAAFPILIVVVLAFFAQKLISPGDQPSRRPTRVPDAGRARPGQGGHALTRRTTAIDVGAQGAARSTRPPIRTTPSRT